jgi:tellurite resistance protein TerC
MKLALPFVKRIAVAVIGFTVILVGVALLMLPGPGLVTIALGLAILATEFVWARSWLNRAREEIEKRNPLKRS